MNAPDAGVIKEFLVKEEETVTVGQDLLVLELGGASTSGDKQEAGQEPKAPASDKQPTSSDPKPTKGSDDSGTASSSPSPSRSQTMQDQGTAPPKKQEPKPTTSGEGTSKKEHIPRSSESKGSEASANRKSTPFGNREERRVYAPHDSKLNGLIRNERSK